MGRRGGGGSIAEERAYAEEEARGNALDQKAEAEDHTEDEEEGHMRLMSAGGNTN